MSALNSIVLRHVIPDIFKDGNSNQPTPESEVWMEEVVFKRGEFYMIQAESGTGRRRYAVSSTATAATIREKSCLTEPTSAHST